MNSMVGHCDLFHRLHVNLVRRPRFAVMEGREYIVLPVVILTEGVHVGSNGPVLYLSEDMEKFAPAWNHKPVVVYHPQKDGQYVSADDPAVLSAYKVGILMSNRVIDGRQEAEVWLERERLKQVEPRILEAIEKGVVVEVSTGLFADNEQVEGEWNGEKYYAIARNYRPDHLALLPDLVGACSVADGCGLFTAAQALPVEKAEQIQRVLANVLNQQEQTEVREEELISALGFTINPVHACKRDGKPGYQWGNQTCYTYTPGDEAGRKEAKRKAHLQGAAIEAYERLKNLERETMETTRSEELENRVPGESAGLCVESPESAVQSRSVNNDTEIGDDQMNSSNTKCECTKTKALVDELISANRDWQEEDREWLESQDEKILKRFIAMQQNRKEDAEKKEEAERKEDLAATQLPPLGNKKREMTVEEYIKQAPKPMQMALARGLAAHQAERKRYIDAIMQNELNQFTQEELNSFEDPMLYKLAALAAREKEKEPEQIDLFSFIGSVGAPQFNQDCQEEHLPLPTMNFATSNSR